MFAFTTIPFIVLSSMIIPSHLSISQDPAAFFPTDCQLKQEIKADKLLASSLLKDLK